MAARKLSSQQALDAARTQVDALRARLTNAQAQIPVAERQLEATRNQLANMQVRAPFAGVVTVKAAQPGEMISPISAGGGFTRTGIGTIVDMDSLEVGVDVNEAYIAQVKAGMPCEAVLDAYPDWRIPAHVLAVIPSADRGKATVKVRVALDQKDERVVPEMGVRVSFLAASPKPQAAPAPGVLLPPEALVQRDGGNAVFVVSEGRAQQRGVKLGADVGKFRLATEGLKAGESVVLSPPAELKQGSNVVNKE